MVAVQLSSAFEFGPLVDFVVRYCGVLGTISSLVSMAPLHSPDHFLERTGLTCAGLVACYFLCLYLLYSVQLAPSSSFLSGHAWSLLRSCEIEEGGRKRKETQGVGREQGREGGDEMEGERGERCERGKGRE